MLGVGESGLARGVGEARLWRAFVLAAKGEARGRQGKERVDMAKHRS